MIIKHDNTNSFSLKMKDKIYEMNVGKDNLIINELINYKFKPFKLNKKYVADFFDVEEFKINDCNYYLFKNKFNKNKRLVYLFHGGGYILPISNNNIIGAGLYSKYLDNADVLLIDYTVGKDSFNKTINEALEGYLYLTKRYDLANVYFAGHSAGGGLCLGFSLYLKDNNYKLPNKLFLASPWLNINSDTLSYIDNVKKDPMFGNFSNQVLPNLYTTDIKNPYASPIYGKFEGLPDTYIFLSDNEVLLDDSITVSNNMDNSYVHIFHGLWHDFYTHDDELEEAQIVWNIIANSIK